MSRRRLDTEDATTVVTTRGKEDVGAILLPALDDHAGPARRLPAGKTTGMINAILDAALKEGPLSPPAEQPAASAPASASARRGPSRTLALLAAAVVLAAAVGAAAAVYVTRTLGDETTSRAGTGKGSGARHRLATGTEPATAPAPEVAPAEIEMEAATVRRPPPPRPDRSRPDRAVTLPDDAPAEDVLALANQRRKDQDWRGADDLYRRVLRSFPGTDAAVVAEVASATIHLAHLGDPPGALKAYRHALATRPRGPLAEEARWGIAEAQRARADRVAEYAALTDFLRAHPDSALRPAALRRQAELSELRRGGEPPP